MAKITQKEVEHVAGLARIRLTEKEKKKFTKELTSILVYFEKLKEIKTENVDPTAQVTGLENVFREDDLPLEPGAGTEKLIDQFPQKDGSYLKVRKVFDKKT